MTKQTETRLPALDDEVAPVPILSADGHVGPLLVEQLREYCPEKLLDDFDAFAVHDRKAKGGITREQVMAQNANYRTDGHHDPEARLRDLNDDKVVAEVIFHGSQNQESIPFQVWYSVGRQRSDDIKESRFSYEGIDQQLVAEGLRIYNRWLADFCAVAPDRFVGLAHLPMWDVDLAVTEVKAAADMGLRGVNFPTMRTGMAPYNDPMWEPFWSTCEDLGMLLGCHSGGGTDEAVYGKGRDQFALFLFEASGFFSQRLIPWMTFSGVFERHPGLRLVISENPGSWWPVLMQSMDSLAQSMVSPGLPKLPSEYCRESVFHGATFISRDEARQAVEEGYDTNMCWGSDYPHTEGTWQNTGDGSSMSHHQIRWAMADLPTESIRRMCGENAIKAFGLDRKRTHEIAAELHAPTPKELHAPLDEVPATRGMLSYRTVGPFS